jgi:peptidoglycan hydrolase-like protein with peptidoglycan-binding domain
LDATDEEQMTKLNRNQPFGEIKPPMQEGAMDRPAHYEQDGKLFDAHDRLIEAGQPAVAAAPAAAEKPPAPAPKPAKAAAAPKETKPAPSAQEALAEQRRQDEIKLKLNQAKAPEKPPMTATEVLNSDLPFAAFKKEAKRILGNQCPASKSDITAALAAFASQPNLNAQRQEESAAEQKDTGKSGVNLAAWGRGQKTYLFSEVRKAIQKEHGAVMTTEHDAVDLLIQAGVITAREARKTNQAAA